MRALPLLLPFFLFATVLACGGDDDDAPETQTPTLAAISEAGPTLSPGETVEPTEPASISPTLPPSQESGLPTSISLERVFPDLTFNSMTGLYQLPSGSWLVTEQAGRVMLIDRAGIQARVVVDLRDRVNSAGFEEGLLGLALAPDFVDTGVLYVYYSAAEPRRSIISRFRSITGDTIDPDTEEIILEVPQPFANHNGGQIVFGPEGYLYIGLGDGGSARDPQGNGQNLGTLLGSVLRIDVSGGGPGYSVPADNPFLGRSGARGEIWASGLRNPWRFSFDAATGDLWVGDVGQDAREEIDLILPGGNYGWNVMEGFDCLGGGSDCEKDGLLLPVIDYANGGGNCSVTGGFVYHGSIRVLQGAYVYADYCSGKIWALRYDGSGVTVEAQIAQADFRISSFAQGNDLEVYVLEHATSGGIYKLAP